MPSRTDITEESAEAVVSRTELSRWVDIAAALNAAHDAGMPVGIDLDGTLTDRRAWSVIWDRDTGRWTVAGYEDQAETDNEEEDIPAAGTIAAGTASTARAEILRALQAYGHTATAARGLLSRADHEPRHDDPNDPAPDPDFRETLDGGHALVIEYGDCEMHASCQCGSHLGMTTPDASLDTFVPAWEHHTNTEVV
ncbi:hypothetical protein ACW4TU_18665 [Streptomyces sp. QTS52]